MLSSAKTQLSLLFSNPILIACIFSWFCAQFLKTIIKLFCRQIHSIKELLELLLWSTGGLPSSHSSLVSCLCTTVAFRSGIDSDIFILAFCFCMVTIRDAVGVRRANGIQARRLNELTKITNERKISDFNPLKEVQGHSPMEVLIGCILGFFIGLAFSTL